MIDFKLDENQMRASQFHLKLKWSYNCMDMGEGKTLTALETARIARVERVLVFCPAYLISNWKAEIQKFYGDSYPAEVEFTSYSATKKMKPSDFVIDDELHYIKNFKAKRTERVYDYMKKHKPTYMIGMSGTPMKNSAWDFFPYFAILNLKHKINFPKDPYAFQAVYCEKIENDFTPSGYAYSGINPEKKEELKALIRPWFYFTPPQLRPTLPKTVNKKYIAKLPRKQAVAMEKALEEGRSQEFMALKAINAELNTETTIKLIKDLIYEGKRPVIFTEHRAPAQLIASEFGTKPILGGVSNAQRNDLLEYFDNHKSLLLVGTYGAMGTGLNITSSDTMVLNDYPFSPSDYDQARKRIHRKGQTKTCFYHHVFSNELDYQIFYKMLAKKKESDEIHGK